ncbi:MAG: hypothetical protein J7J22_06385 [Candidatus Verstraetearchaeota archaeon]|nr:hypothetical protein [Candidatus Verstraetearchaeota archaeon]
MQAMLQSVFVRNASFRPLLEVLAVQIAYQTLRGKLKSELLIEKYVLWFRYLLVLSLSLRFAPIDLYQFIF